MSDMNETSFGFASVTDEGNRRYKHNKLYVIPQTQKTGAGKALLVEVIDSAKQNNENILFLQVKRDNIAKAFMKNRALSLQKK